MDIKPRRPATAVGHHTQTSSNGCWTSNPDVQQLLMDIKPRRPATADGHQTQTSSNCCWTSHPDVQQRGPGVAQTPSYLRPEVRDPRLGHGHVALADLHEVECLVDVRPPHGVAVTRNPLVHHRALHALDHRPVVPGVLASVLPPVLVGPLDVDPTTEVGVVVDLTGVGDLGKRS